MSESKNERTDSVHFSTRCSTTIHGINETCNLCEDTAPSPLERFASGPAFEAFVDHLRQAAQVLTVQDFMRLRRHYDAAWYEILGEL